MNNQHRTPLFTALKSYHAKQVIPFDVPGHKRGLGAPELKDFLGAIPLELDVNSMKPLDNIANPMGVIREAELLMAEAFGADYAFFLVNGTTQGVQAMIMSFCGPEDKIIMPRNVHKSAMKALILCGAVPVYVQPEVDVGLGIANGVTFETFKETVEANRDAKAVFLINPTYYGTTSDLKKMIDLAHANQMVVIVDEAHGAHFAFHDELPQSSMSLGSDMACVSLHKTGGSLTQSSALLVNETLIHREKVKTILNLTQTTSASYLLMSSLDIARKRLATEGTPLLTKVLELARYARTEINQIGGYYAFGKEKINGAGVYDYDETKLGIKVSDLGLSGLHVYDILRDHYNIQVEFGDTHNLLAIISLGDTIQHIEQLINALRDIKQKYQTNKKIQSRLDLTNPEVILSPREAFYSKKIILPLKDSIDKISGEHIMSYPPGIPVVSPGERIDKHMIDYITFLKKEKSMLTGTQDPEINSILVLE